MPASARPLPDALQEFRVRQLKEFGCNAIRTSHNPPTPELLDVCDRLGMLVLDESRLMGSDSANMKKWDDQIRRDRNHPSVAIWCIANEQFMVQDTPQAANVARTMQDYVKQLDPTRPVTYASPEGDVYRGINSVIEVRGWNYHYGPDMDRYHAEHPNQPNIGTEQASVVGTRGIYANDQQHGYVAAYDVVWPGWTTTAESWWSFFAVRPWLSGAFVWTGFDYRGEPTPYWWPCINSHFGILDTCGFPKDVFYYYQSWWTTNTVLHLLPHWNWPGKEGQEILVEAFSNCKQVELFLNGESLGKQAMKLNSKLSWQVKYAPGTLSAKGYDASGNVIGETKVETTGDADANSTDARPQNYQCRRRGRGGVHRFRRGCARPRGAGGAEQNSFQHRRRGQHYWRRQRRPELSRTGCVRSERARAWHCHQRLAHAACQKFRTTAAPCRNTRMILTTPRGKPSAAAGRPSKHRTPRRFTARISR